MFFLFKWWAQFKYGSDAVEEFERNRTQPRPQKRPQQRVKGNRLNGKKLARLTPGFLLSYSMRYILYNYGGKPC